MKPSNNSLVRLVFTGLIGGSEYISMAADLAMEEYNLIKGKEYDTWEDSGFYYVVENYGQGQPQDISMYLISVYFEPLSEIRNNKIDEILK